MSKNTFKLYQDPEIVVQHVVYLNDEFKDYVEADPAPLQRSQSLSNLAENTRNTVGLFQKLERSESASDLTNTTSATLNK